MDLSVDKNKAQGAASKPTSNAKKKKKKKSGDAKPSGEAGECKPTTLLHWMQRQAELKVRPLYATFFVLLRLGLFWVVVNRRGRHKPYHNISDRSVLSTGGTQGNNGVAILRSNATAQRLGGECRICISSSRPRGAADEVGLTH